METPGDPQKAFQAKIQKKKWEELFPKPWNLTKSRQQEPAWKLVFAQGQKTTLLGMEIPGDPRKKLLKQENIEEEEAMNSAPNPKTLDTTTMATLVLLLGQCSFWMGGGVFPSVRDCARSFSDPPLWCVIIHVIRGRLFLTDRKKLPTLTWKTWKLELGNFAGGCFGFLVEFWSCCRKRKRRGGELGKWWKSMLVWDW